MGACTRSDQMPHHLGLKVNKIFFIRKWLGKGKPIGEKRRFRTSQPLQISIIINKQRVVKEKRKVANSYALVKNLQDWILSQLNTKAMNKWGQACMFLQEQNPVIQLSSARGWVGYFFSFLLLSLYFYVFFRSETLEMKSNMLHTTL